MEQKKLAAYTQELLAEAKKNKSIKTMDAFLIGFTTAVVVYSIYARRFGVLTLIPLFIAVKLLNKPSNNKELEELLKARNLK